MNGREKTETRICLQLQSGESLGQTSCVEFQDFHVKRFAFPSFENLSFMPDAFFKPLLNILRFYARIRDTLMN